MNGRSLVPAVIVALTGFAPAVASQGPIPPATRDTVPAARQISDAIARAPSEELVTIAGRASVTAGRLQADVLDIAIQDASGGIRIFSRGPRFDVHEGDSVVATGTVRRYQGSVELVVNRIATVPAPARILLPREIPLDTAVIARHAGQLVRVHARVTSAGRSEGGRWVRLGASRPGTEGTLTVWVPANHGAPIDLARIHTNDEIVAAGIVTSRQDNANEPVVWQLLPRDAADLRVTSGHAALSPWILWSVLGAAAAIMAALVIARLAASRLLRVLRETEARYRQLLDLSPEAVVVHNRGAILLANPAAARLLGLGSTQALLGRSIADFLHADSRARLDEIIGAPASTADSCTTRVRARLLASTGGGVEAEMTSSPCTYHGRPATVLLARDITAQVRHERDLHAMALIDELTGLHNRRGFTLFAEQELARARRHARSPIVVFVDLDGLKEIREAYGRAAGDAAIQLVATAFKGILRETDIVARWSEDELIALMGEGGELAAPHVRPRLDAAIAALSSPDQPQVVTVAVGTAPLDPALPLRDAMERADAELYRATKRRGRSALRAASIDVDATAKPR
jgi:diguanylate cyclase (GGDEF)-like protein/PAS domain S-box-containing protein